MDYMDASKTAGGGIVGVVLAALGFKWHLDRLATEMRDSNVRLSAELAEIKKKLDRHERMCSEVSDIKEGVSRLVTREACGSNHRIVDDRMDIIGEMLKEVRADVRKLLMHVAREGGNV